MTHTPLDLMLHAIKYYHNKQYVSAETNLSAAREEVYRLAYEIPTYDLFNPAPDDTIYLGLFGVYPPELNDEHHTKRASEGTKRISDLMDDFVVHLKMLTNQYSDVGADDTSAREHIFEKLYDRYMDVKLDKQS